MKIQDTCGCACLILTAASEDHPFIAESAHFSGVFVSVTFTTMECISLFLLLRAGPPDRRIHRREP
jgi:hypothetical protein